MLNIFKLTDAISESAVGTTNIASIQPYEFIGSMAECTAEFNYEVMSEAASFMEFYANSEEIMTEAAVMNSAAMDTISESVFTKVKEGVTKFIDKIIAMVKGVIEKLKAFMYKLTGKTDKWLSVMRPKIKDAQGRRGAGEASAEMHEWDVEYINNGMKSGVDAMVKEILPSIDMKINAQSIAQSAASGAAGHESRGKYDSSGNAREGDDRINAQLKNFDDATELLNKAIEKYQEEFPAKLASWMGVSSNSSLDAVWKAVAEKATGGEKKTVTYGNQVGNMLNAIDGSKKCIDGLKKAYDQHLKDLGNYRKEIETQFSKLEVLGKDDNRASSVTAAAKAYANAYSKRTVSQIQLGETACNNARGMNLNYVQKMTSEYMTVLTRFAGIKEKKD